MLNAATHDLLQGMVEYMTHLDERRKEVYNEYLHYCNQLDRQRALINKTAAEAEDLYGRTILQQGINGIDWRYIK